MRPRLDVHHLQMIAAISRTGSAADAALELGVTASALSHRIREAERRLDLTLFTRMGRSLRLTPAGEMLARAADHLLVDMEEIEHNVVRMAQGVRYVVRLTIGSYSSFHWLPEFLAWFAREHPDYEVDIVANAVFTPVAALQERTIDLAILPEVPAPAGLKGVSLFDDELVAIMAPSHPLAGRDWVTPEDLGDDEVLTYSFQNLPGHELDRFWRPSHVVPRRYRRVELIEAIVEMVKAGFGISILARWAMAPHLESGSLASARLAPDGVSVEWQALLRDGEGEDSPPEVFARSLAAWWSDR
mgnify:CR=1 FL=1